MAERRKRDWLTIAQVGGGAATEFPYSVEFTISNPHSDVQIGVSIGWEPAPDGSHFSMNGSLCEIVAQRQNRNGHFLNVPGNDAQVTSPVVELETYGDAYDLGGSPSVDRWRGIARFPNTAGFGGTGATVMVCATWDFPSTMCDADIDRLWGKCQLNGPAKPLILLNGE